MFRNKIVVRSELPSASPFFLLQLDLPVLDPSSPSPSLPPPLAGGQLEALCWKLSRQWRLSCFPHSSQVFIVYQRGQRHSIDRVVEDLVKAVPDIIVGVEKELESPLLIAKAVEIGLRTVMLDQKWTCVGDNSFVDSMFGRDDEGNSLCALNVQVQHEKNGNLVLLVAPEVLRFSRYKISDLLSSNYMGRFISGEEVSFENSSISTACTVIPSLCEGHVIGLSIQAPNEENFESLKELWSYKYGVALHSDYFISVQLAHGGCVKSQWFPSAYVLRGSGFTPAPQSIRFRKALQALESFIKLLGACEFFSQGMLKIKEVSSLGSCLKVADWVKATDIMCSIPKDDIVCGHESSLNRTDLISNDLLSALDFHTPKPTYMHILSNTELKNTLIVEKSISSSKPWGGKEADCIHDTSISSRIKLIPNFRKVAPLTTITRSDVKNKISVDKTKDCISVDADINSSTNSITDTGKVTTNIESGKISAYKSIDSSNSKSGTVVKKVADVTTSMLSGSVVRKVADVTTSMLSELKSSNDCPISTENTSTHSSTAQRPKGSRKQEKHGVPPPINVPAHPGDGNHSEKGHQAEEDKNENKLEGSTKMKGKENADTNGIVLKVTNSHKRGELQSLTIADLKCFLVSKKAKVGGRKEELVQRVTALLA